MIHLNINLLTSLALTTTPLASPLTERNQIESPKKRSSSSSQRASFRRLEAVLRSAPTLEPRGQYVGKLEEKWQFPSDHLPIGMSWDGLNLASWNVMNSQYFDWILTDDQGLIRSLIAEEHVYLGDSGLTLRDIHNIELIQEMFQHPTHPRSLLSLQECSAPFLKELQNRLPSHIQLVLDSDQPLEDQNVVLYDTRILQLEEKKSVNGLFSEQPERSIQDLLFSRLETNEPLRILNGHLPGNPKEPARDEFASYLAKTESEIATIAMGDMNFNELEMEDALRKAYPLRAPSFNILSPYCTNIDPYTCFSKAIDHFLVKLPASSQIRLNTGEEVLSGLQTMIDLLDV